MHLKSRRGMSAASLLSTHVSQGEISLVGRNVFLIKSILASDFAWLFSVLPSSLWNVFIIYLPFRLFSGNCS